MRSAPCCWMIGSATPSSFTRLRRVWMFCCRASSCSFFTTSGLMEATIDASSPATCSRIVRSGISFWISLSAAARWSASRKRTTTRSPSRARPV